MIYKKIIYTSLIVALAGGMTACSYKTAKKPLIGPMVAKSVTPYSAALACVGQRAAKMKRVVLAVDEIPDRTGKFSLDEGGYQVTQGAEDMAISALGKTKAYSLVERLRLGVPYMEIEYANKFLLKDANNANNVKNDQGRMARNLRHSVMQGSDYVLTGSITEINYNIMSGGFELFIDGAGGGWREFWWDVAIDLRLINTKTSKIVMTIPMRKQLWGYENKAGVTRFFGVTLVEFNAGQKVHEPMGLAVRSVLESGVVEMTKKLYNLPKNICQSEVAEADKMGKRGFY